GRASANALVHLQPLTEPRPEGAVTRTGRSPESLSACFSVLRSESSGRRGLPVIRCLAIRRAPRPVSARHAEACATSGLRLGAECLQLLADPAKVVAEACIFDFALLLVVDA